MKAMLLGQTAADAVAAIIKSRNPAMVSRFGTTEADLISFYLNRDGLSSDSRFLKLGNNLCKLSGFFPNCESSLERFCQESLQIIPEIDLLGIRWEKFDEQFFVAERALCAQLSPACRTVEIDTLISPFFVEKKWMIALAGLRVLVVHPFIQTIINQYGRREQLFPNNSVLPLFDLVCVPAVQSLGSESEKTGYTDWFSALSSMQEKIEEVDFDIALIGAGAYGMFLAAHCKRIGKIGIHMGGGLQLLFGIKGRRWVDGGSPDYLGHIMSNNWVYPNASETPRSARDVENSCYWGL
jgi:hypothetical protein